MRSMHASRRRLVALLPLLGLPALRPLLGLPFAAFSCKSQSELPPLGTLPAFSLLDQNGRRYGASELRGQLWVAAFMFTRCPTICPRITRRMRAVQEQAQSRKLPLRLVSFSVDPDNDTPAVLATYAASYHADTTSWSFLTGDLEVVRRTAVDGFKLALDGKADAGAPDFGILHGSHLVLVDRELRIRGYYATNDDERMRQLLDDAAQLA